MLSCALAAAGEEAVGVMMETLGFSTYDVRDGIQGLMDCLPRWHTRSARLQLNPAPHSEVKSMLERRFEKQIWPVIGHRYDSYRFGNYEGSREVTERTGDHTGGWRIELERDGARPFVFVRGSRTEAGIWRVIADSPDAAEARELMDAATQMLEASDEVETGS